MAEFLLDLEEKDVKGACLKRSVVAENSVDDLKRWLLCRGFSSSKSESKKSLCRRVTDLIESGMSRYVIDPDDEIVNKINERISKKSSEVPLPLMNNWTTNLSNLPDKLTYISIYEYLLKRNIQIIHMTQKQESDDENDCSSSKCVSLPVAEKPLRKGYNFFASGHVDDVKLNVVDKFTHIKSIVLSSMKDCKYKSSFVIAESGLVIEAKCDCVVGKGGKCNHIAALMFYCLDFQHHRKTQAPSKTEKLQQWHRPSRKAKKNTKPTKTGKRIIRKHILGRKLKRKRALEGYEDYEALPKEKYTCNKKEHMDNLKTSLKKIADEQHDIGFLQLLSSSTETASEDYENESGVKQIEVISYTPEELVIKKLQVNQTEQTEIEKKTRGQSSCSNWFQERRGRITASICKQACGKGTSIVSKIVTVGKPREPKLEALKYGIENEAIAADQYQDQMSKNGNPVELKECGLFVSLENGELAASPDRIVIEKNTTERGCLEIKCCFKGKEGTPEEAVKKHQQESSFPLKFVKDQIVLKDKHSYFYQVQMQMATTGCKWCDFVFFTNKSAPVLIERITFDNKFWQSTKEKLLDYHCKNIVPALIALNFKNFRSA